MLQDRQQHDRIERIDRRAGDKAGQDKGKATVYVLDVPEFAPYVAACRAAPGCELSGPENGYWRITSAAPIVFERKPLGLVPALWNAALTGGFDGQIKVFDRQRLEIAPEVTA